MGHFTGVALDRLFKLVLTYMTEVHPAAMQPIEVATILSRDYVRSRGRLPSFLAEITGESTRFRAAGVPAGSDPRATPKRQARHLVAPGNETQA